MKCMLCSSDNPRLLFVAQDIHGRQILSNDKFDIFQCDACNVAFTQVHVGPEYYKKYYRKDYYCPINSNGLIGKCLFFLQEFSFKKRLKLIERYKSSKGNRILEVGCAKGEFLNSLPESYDKCAVEINEDGYNFVKENYKNIDIHNVRINDRDFKASKFGEFDVIIMWHVFEHVEDPAVFIDNLSKLLAKDGVLIFDIPNKDSLGFNLTQHWWFHLDAPRHLFHYNYKSIDSLIQRSKLKIVGHVGNIWDYPQDLPASFYSKFKTANFILNSLFFIFVLPVLTIFRFIVALFFSKKAEINTYIAKRAN
ncbi:MAG: class I SAM-dependent methyltransferase [Candidatus Omnitrophica bacterium]|nr:class I SAM-dependent methyltransferase [Candidatus Omnitrophota bacterium]MBU1926085.1 class I SAM-dependent methyltransferase [Candidatus Omnitrophota bacterium]